MPLNMQPLSDKFGVAITNVDLSKDIDQSLFDEIVDVFVKKQVLVFRSQHIEPQHQVAFSRRFGPLEMMYDEDQRVPGFPEVAILSNEKVDGKFIGVVAAGDFWHSDQTLILFVDENQVARGEYDWSPDERMRFATGLTAEVNRMRSAAARPPRL